MVNKMGTGVLEIPSCNVIKFTKHLFIILVPIEVMYHLYLRMITLTLDETEVPTQEGGQAPLLIKKMSRLIQSTCFITITDKLERYRCNQSMY